MSGQHQPMSYCAECGEPWPCSTIAPPKTCANTRCLRGGTFTSRRVDAIYCSPQCGKAVSARRTRRGISPPGVESAATGAARTHETIAEAAERTGVSTKTIRRRIAEGRLTGYRFGPTLIRLDPAEVDGLMQPIPNEP